MTTITEQLSIMDFKLGQPSILAVSKCSEILNLNLLGFNATRNKDLASATCPIPFLAKDCLFSPLLVIICNLTYKTYTTNIKRYELICL